MNDELERMDLSSLPWTLHEGSSPLGDTGDHDDWIEIRSGGNVIARWYGEEDDGSAALICAAVNALPEMLARVKRYEEALSVIVEGAQLSEYEGLTDDRGLSMRLCGPNFLEDFTLGDFRRARAALNQETKP
jgi:hypothetical protein